MVTVARLQVDFHLTIVDFPVTTLEFPFLLRVTVVTLAFRAGAFVTDSEQN